ncbi:MAG TPA: ROK family protein [Candidatus Acidoferrum sp.]|nr:ROK family protein [Candidatus Acidoferrum sp.]
MATSETVRDINSRIMLNLVRKHQPVSRADLMRYSGLQRSTVSAIAEQLIAERWLKEGAVGNLPRGRKPTFLHLNTERCGVVGVDIQPATTTLAVASIDSQIVAQESMPTQMDPLEFVAELSRRIKNLIQAYPQDAFEGVGVSLPGRIDATSQQLIFAPRLNWGEFDLKEHLEQSLGLPVELENAANACALAELWSGRHGDGVRDLVAVTVSDGIGVGMMMNGQMVRGSRGVAGEFGHVTLVPEGPLCRCGNTGCWEALASNAAAVRYYLEAASPRNGEAASRNGKARPTFGDILRLAEQGDAHATQALQQMAHHLGAGIAMLVTGLAPDVLVVVGEVTRAWEMVGPAVEEVVKQRSLTHAVTRILPTDPEAQPRLRGTIVLVLQKHFAAPLIA